MNFSVLGAGVDQSADDNLAIRLAALHGYEWTVRHLLLDPRVDPSADDNSAIRWAAAKGHTHIVRRLIVDSRVDPAAMENDAIHAASVRGHIEVVKVLLADPRVDPTKACVRFNNSLAAVVADYGVFVARHASCAWNAVAAWACAFVLEQPYTDCNKKSK